MSTTPSPRQVDLAPPRPAAVAYLAVAVGVVAVLLSFVAWDWFDGGGVALGIPAGAVALVLGLRARREGARGMGTAAIVLAAVTVLVPLVWIAAGAI
ncbi:MAG: hypothetical protein AB7O78_08240 [Thermoleophilia bacterium]